jgi:hypothetical protein
VKENNIHFLAWGGGFSSPPPSFLLLGEEEESSFPLFFSPLRRLSSSTAVLPVHSTTTKRPVSISSALSQPQIRHLFEVFGSSFFKARSINFRKLHLHTCPSTEFLGSTASRRPQKRHHRTSTRRSVFHTCLRVDLTRGCVRLTRRCEARPPPRVLCHRHRHLDSWDATRPFCPTAGAWSSRADEWVNGAGSLFPPPGPPLLLLFYCFLFMLFAVSGLRSSGVWETYSIGVSVLFLTVSYSPQPPQRGCFIYLNSGHSSTPS